MLRTFGSHRNARQSLWFRLDWLAIVAALLLVTIGLVMIYSAYEVSAPEGEHPLWDNTVFRQGFFAVLGLGLCLLTAFIDYHVVVSFSRWIYLGIVLFLALTLVVGQTAFGARSWMDLGRFGPQPSELAKILMIVVFAHYLGSDPEGMESPKAFLTTILLLLPPILLIYLQPDFGTALILGVTWAGMIFLAGVRWRYLIVLVILALVLAPIVWFRLEDYMRQRLLTFLYPENDPSGASYNITQALISIGSGGLWGKGALQGTQSQLHFLRVRHTDFIFSVLAEEFGFVGSLVLLSLFVLLILRLVRIAMAARDMPGRLLAGGVAVMIFAQMFINLGMNANLMPVTGLPLPLVSYGGSSLMSTLLALGLAESVAVRNHQSENPMLR